MNKIKALKENYNIPSEEELSQCFRTDFHRMEDTLREREQHLFGLNMKLQELKSKVEVLEDSACTEKQILSTKLQELSACNERLNELKVDKNTLLQEVHKLDVQRNTMRNSKPNLKDQQTIEHGRKKFQYYKQLTGIRWDFGAPKEITKGYVTNGKDYIHSFSYKTQEHGSKLEGLLWREIEKATGRLGVAETDENRVPNN